MKRTSRKPSKLSESLHLQLNSYALAASAAGVGLLALSRAAEAKIVYTPAHVVVRSNDAYKLDLNHDGITDFTIQNLRRSSSGNIFDTLSAVPAVGNRVLELKYSRVFWAYALYPGERIGPKQYFFLPSGFMAQAETRGFTRYYGLWTDVRNRYLGLKFRIRGKAHYGWARLNVTVACCGRGHASTLGGIRATLTGYAYETIPNKPIIAGKTKGPDVITLPTASLGHLARGASAMKAWRKESAGVTH
jgi:hypothetical protein